jgi:hypothetical protein
VLELQKVLKSEALESILVVDLEQSVDRRSLNSLVDRQFGYSGELECAIGKSSEAPNFWSVKVTAFQILRPTF